MCLLQEQVSPERFSFTEEEEEEEIKHGKSENAENKTKQKEAK